MFTGIIAVRGVVKKMNTAVNMIHLDVDVGALASKIHLGDSVCINGVCLTVVAKKNKVIRFDMIKETLISTTLGFLKNADLVNCELALTPQTPMGGHFVTGHVDEVGTITQRNQSPNWVSLTISISKINQKYIAPKGSITLDGISLTVGKVLKGSFEVYLIPMTLTLTTLTHKTVGDQVNIETDILAKYVFNLKKNQTK